MMNKQAWSNVLRGCAYGDAWGNKNEFQSYETLTARNYRGPELPASLIITDDTQMTLFLASALDVSRGQSPNIVQDCIIKAWVDWYDDPDNTPSRAPGNTCLKSIGAYKRGATWPTAMVPDNDGCGSVMRVSAAAFLAPRTFQGVAAWQAASTHGGANGIAASLMAAWLIRSGVMLGLQAGDVLDYAIRMCDDGRVWLGVDKWLTPELMAELPNGFAELKRTLQGARDALDDFALNPWLHGDPCLYGGEGWRAHHALATALLCVDMLPDEPIEALRRATVTGGDSDSIAAIAGAILGAVHRDPWPTEWFGRLETRYQHWITEADEYDFDGREN